MRDGEVGLRGPIATIATHGNSGGANAMNHMEEVVGNEWEWYGTAMRQIERHSPPLAG